VGTTQLEQKIAAEDAKKKAAILDKLAELGGSRVTQESGIAYHEDPNEKQIMLPQGLTLKVATKLLSAQAQALEEEHDFDKVFPFRPFDGAYACQEVLKKIFGVTGQGRAVYGMFGEKYPPKFVNVEVQPGKEVRVPWGKVDFPLLDAVMTTGYQNDPQKGALFQLTITAPKKFAAQIEGLFIAIEEYLKQNSIYKGKCIIGVGRVTRVGFESPQFLDPYMVDPESVAYKQEVYDRLNASVWGPIRTAALQRAEGQKLNRKTLLEGPYGTGKSLAGGLTARVAFDNGWTFVQCKTGEDDLEMVLKMAELYAPAVVFMEDVDNLIEKDPKEMAKLLELFDGMSTKNKEVMVLMTSNHVETMSKGMTRAGRIDAVIHIGDLDAEAIQRLIAHTFRPDQLDPKIDFEAIQEAMKEYEPAFIMGTFSLTKSNAIIRTESTKFKLTTRDFVLAAETLRPQHNTHQNAQEHPDVDTVEQVLAGVFRNAVREEVDRSQVDFDEGGRIKVALHE